jgi:hypothetical protein
MTFFFKAYSNQPGHSAHKLYDRIIALNSSINDSELDEFRSRLQSFKVRKGQSDRKSKRALFNQEVSILKLRNRVFSCIWDIVTAQQPSTNDHLPSQNNPANAEFINLIGVQFENQPIVNYNEPEDDVSDFADFPALPNKTQLSLDEEVIESPDNEPKPDESTRSASLKLTRQENLRKVIGVLQQTRASNKLKIENLICKLEQQKAQAKAYDCFVPNQPKGLDAFAIESLFQNEISESDVLYNLKSFFKIENRYLQLQQQRMKISSNRKIAEYNSGSRLKRDGA